MGGVILRSSTHTILYIKMVWNCIKGCSDCCGVVPLNKDIFKKYKDKIQIQPEELLELKGRIYPLTEDFKCVFLDRENAKCVIYEDRPKLCKDYGLIEELQCPYIKMNGNLRSPAKQRRMQRIINKQVNQTMRMLEKRIKQS